MRRDNALAAGDFSNLYAQIESSKPNTAASVAYFKGKQQSFEPMNHEGLKRLGTKRHGNFGTESCKRCHQTAIRDKA
jgi:hypothetical protein